MQDDPNLYPLFDRDNYLNLYDDPQFRFDCAVMYDIPESELTDYELSSYIADLESNDLSEETRSIDEAFEKAVATQHPEWGGSFALMATGTVGRWDGTSAGHSYYFGYKHLHGEEVGPFHQLICDTGYNGLFKDCEIDTINGDREGTVHIRGVHHDGAVNVAVRAIEADTEDIESEWDWYFEECLKPDDMRDDEIGDDVVRAVAAYPDDSDRALAAFLEGRWAAGACAHMDEYYGYSWPAIEGSTSLDDDASIRQFLGIPKNPGYIDIDGYRINADFAVGNHQDDVPMRLDLITSDGEVFFVGDEPDVTGGMVLVMVDTDAGVRTPRLASDNFFACDAYEGALAAIAAGDARPLFASRNASYAINEAKAAAKNPSTVADAARAAAISEAARRAASSSVIASANCTVSEAQHGIAR